MDVRRGSRGDTNLTFRWRPALGPPPVRHVFHEMTADVALNHPPGDRIRLPNRATEELPLNDLLSRLRHSRLKNAELDLASSSSCSHPLLLLTLSLSPGADINIVLSEFQRDRARRISHNSNAGRRPIAESFRVDLGFARGQRSSVVWRKC